MAPHLDITKTTSSPADPGAPSFLTTLPPEVRNAISEVLFKRNEPVFLHKTSAYYTAHPEQIPFLQDYSLRVYMTFVERYDALMNESMLRAQELEHDFGRGLSMLLCCRQVYSESVGVLYGANTFTILRALHRHDKGWDDRRFLTDPTYHQFSYACECLLGIGSQASLLRKVWIDTGATCLSDCARADTRFGLLPLLRLLWTHPNVLPKIRFHDTGRRLIPHATESSDEEARMRLQTNTLVLNNLIDNIGAKGQIELGHYSELSITWT